MKKQRDVSYEVIRVLAMIMVILVHELPIYILSDSTNPTVYMAFDGFFCLCNALFFLLAGRFAFKINTEDKSLYKKYYWKKVIGLIIPMFVYMAIKNWHVMAYNQHLDVNLFSYIRHFGVSLVNGFCYMEYWFLYILIACMIVVPFAARMLQNMKDRDKKAFLIVGLIMTTLTTYIPLLKVDFAVEYYFVGHVLSFFLGFLIEDIFKEKKAKKLLFILGPIFFAINTAINVSGFHNGYKSTSPFYILTAISIFLFIKNYVKVPKKLEKPILFLGKHSLGVYMTHFMVLYTINDLIKLPSGIIGFLVASLLVLIFSELISFVLDSTIIKWLQKLTIKLFRLEKTIAK